MKLTTPYTILNQKFNKMDFIRYTLKQKKSLKLKDCMMTIEKCSNLILASCIVRKNLQQKVMDMFNLFERFQLVEVNYFI